MTRFVLPLMVLWLSGLGSTAVAQRAIPLHIAIEKGLVNVKVIGRGSSTGDSVQVTVRRETRRNVRVEVVPGTVIECQSADVQSMALGGVKYERIGDEYREADSIELTDDKEHIFILQGYCRDFGKPTPQAQHTFHVVPPDQANASVLVQAKRLGASTKLTQVAIWIQRSHVSDAELQKSFPVSLEEIQAARQLLVSIEQPEVTVDVQVLIEKIGERLAERRAKRSSRPREKQRDKGVARVVRGLQLEVFDKIKIALEK